MNRITKQQLKAIWAIAHQLGFDEKELHACVEVLTGRRSIRHLTRSQAARVIDRLLQRGGVGNRIPSAGPGLKETATKAQWSMIDRLLQQAGWDSSRLLRLARRMYGIRTLDELGIREASGLIEAFKAIEKRRSLGQVDPPKIRAA